jgi:dipeptidase
MEKIKSFFKKSLAFIIVTAFILSDSIIAHACTQFYFGKGTTDDGSYIWGRSEDIDARFTKLYTVREAATHSPGDMYVSSTGFKYPYPQRTLRYTLVKDSVLNEGITPEPYAEVGMNERNVAVSASVTLSSGKAAITGTTNGIDRMVSSRNGGLGEVDMTTIILMQATSARHGCEILANAIDTYGAATRDGVMISDPNEVWYFQILSGRQYVGVKCPDDKIGFSPNITGNVDITDTANVIVSPNLVSIAQAAGTLVTDADGNIKIADSYASAPPTPTGRLRLGTYYLKGMEGVDALSSAAPYPYMDYFTAPRSTGKYTLYEAMRFLAFRGEGTQWYAGSATGNGNSIGNDNQLETHVFNVRSDMPAPLATVKWLCMGPAEFGIYLPYYGSLITETYEMYYKPDVKVYNNTNPDNNSVYHVFRELYTLCKGPRGAAGVGTAASRARYGDGVKQFWERYQKELIAQQKIVDADMVRIYNADPELAKLRATELSKAVAKEAYDYAKLMLAELKAFQAAGTEGNFVPSVLADNAALPHYAKLAPNVSINEIELSAATSKQGIEETVNVTVHTNKAIDVTDVKVELVDAFGASLSPAVVSSGVVINNRATLPIKIANSLDVGNYKIKVSLGRNELVDLSQVFTIEVSQPVIVENPLNKTVLRGDDVIFKVYATGGELSYQWKYNGVDIPGQTSDTLQLTKVNPGHTGSYSVVVSNSVGTAESKAATLTVNVQPLSISVHPKNQNVVVGTVVSFNVAAKYGEAPYAYQWQKKEKGIWQDIAHAEQSTYAFTAAMDLDDTGYRCVVTDLTGKSVISKEATLKVRKK